MTNKTIQYFRDVLGIQYWPKPLIKDPVVLILDLPLKGEGLAHNVMLHNMMKALGLAMTDLTVIELMPQDFDAVVPLVLKEKCVLCFSEEIRDLIDQRRPDWKVFSCAGPRELEKNLAKKSATWTRLKDLSSFIKDK